MKRSFHLASLPVIAALVMTTSVAVAQTTTFTYQGQLTDGGEPANGDYDLQFSLTDAATGGSVIGTLTRDPVAVSDGVFTVQLDYGAPAFIGFNRWLEIAVRPSGSSDPYEILSPRQPVTSTPYAIHAGSVNASSLIGQITDANLSTTLTAPRSFTSPGNTFFGNGANLTQLNAGSVAAGTLADARLSPNVALRSGGNAFTGNQHVESGNIAVGGGGNVGIGTLTPSRRLHVVGGAGDSSIIEARSSPSSNFGPQLRLNNPNGEEWIFVSNGSINGPLGTLGIVQSGGGTRLAINPDGNVGIGTHNPGQHLQIGDFDTVADRFMRVATAGGNSHRSGIELLHFNDGNGYQIYSDERGSALGLHIRDLESGEGATRLFVEKSSGDIGIGTTSPRRQLSLSGPVPEIQFNDTDSATPGWHIGQAANDFTIVETDVATRLQISPGGNTAITGNTTITGNTVITGNSKLGINQSVSNGTLWVTASTAGNGGDVPFAVSRADGTLLVRTSDFGGNHFFEVGTGNASKPGGGSWAVSSDRRLKKDIADLNGALDKMLQLRSVTYRYKDPSAIGQVDRVHTGFIAQEAEEVFPEWVSEDGRGNKILSITGFEALTARAFRDLREEKDGQIEALKAENEALSARLAALEGKLDEVVSLVNSRESVTEAK